MKKIYRRPVIQLYEVRIDNLMLDMSGVDNTLGFKGNPELSNPTDTYLSRESQDVWDDDDDK